MSDSKKDMICAAVRDLLPSYIENLTEEATNAFVEQHLAECPDCRGVKRAMLHIETPAEQAQSDFHNRLRIAHRRFVRRAWISAALIMLILCACFLPLPRVVRMDVEAVKWRSGSPEEGAETVSVSIDGLYLDYLFRDDVFDGDLMIGGVEISQQTGALSRLTFPDSYALLFYENEESLLNSVGAVAASPGFSEFAILLYEEGPNGSHGWQGSSGLVITHPARTREEAVCVTQRICHLNGVWLADTVWEGGLTREEYDALHPQSTP